MESNPKETWNYKSYFHETSLRYGNTSRAFHISNDKAYDRRGEMRILPIFPQHVPLSALWGFSPLHLSIVWSSWVRAAAEPMVPGSSPAFAVDTAVSGVSLVGDWTSLVEPVFKSMWSNPGRQFPGYWVTTWAWDKPKTIVAIIIHVTPFVSVPNEAWRNLGYTVHTVRYDECYNRA